MLRVIEFLEIMVSRQNFSQLYLNLISNQTYLIIGMPMAHNAAALVAQYRIKMRHIYDLWVARKGINIPIQEIREVYGPESYAYEQ